MNADNFANPLSSTELRNIRRQAEALRAAYLRSLFRRLAAAFSRPSVATNGGLTAAR
ncbi:RSP_7527 family protein [Azospirillum argentinense]